MTISTLVFLVGKEIEFEWDLYLSITGKAAVPVEVFKEVRDFSFWSLRLCADNFSSDFLCVDSQQISFYPLNLICVSPDFDESSKLNVAKFVVAFVSLLPAFRREY